MYSSTTIYRPNTDVTSSARRLCYLCLFVSLNVICCLIIYYCVFIIIPTLKIEKTIITRDVYSRHDPGIVKSSLRML